MAVKVTGEPLGADDAVGAMLIPDSADVETDRIALAEVMPPAEAVIGVLPIATPVVIPVLLFIVATAVLPVAQVT